MPSRSLGDWMLSEASEMIPEVLCWMMAAMEKGNYEEALQHAEAGLALSDDRAKKEIAFNQAVCYEYLGQYEKALELFRSYEEQYGQDEKADHEIAFLVTR